MPKPNFRVVDNENPHSRDIARKAVKRFRTLVEQERLPISNQICTGARNLFVDEVIRRSQRAMPEDIGPRYQFNPEFFIKAVLVVMLLLLGSYLVVRMFA